MNPRHRYLTGTVALLAALVVAPAAANAAPAAPCHADSLVRETLPNGTTWQMCWRVRPQHGLVLEKVFVSSTRFPKPVQVLNSIAVAQLNVPYDTGDTEYNDITEYGFGGGYMQTLGGHDCRGGSARVGSDGSMQPERRALLCVSAEPSGLAYRLENPTADKPPISKQGHDLVLRTVSKVGWYEYVSEYRFADNGRITARLGATGDLSPNDYTTSDMGWPVGKGAKSYAANHHHSAFWRVDFNIDGAGKEKVEQYDTERVGTGQVSAALQTVRTVIPKEGSFTKVNRRWWRVVSLSSRNKDGHPRSYQLETGGNDPYEAHPETTPDVTFTQHKACEQFATGNADPQCPYSRSILDYTRNRETMTDPVMWVRVGFHHVPRDEDQSPMPVHWQGFDLTPRDFTETNVLTPREREGVNGEPAFTPQPSPSISVPPAE